MSEPVYRRALWEQAELRADPGAGTIRGYAAVFDSPTTLFPGFREVVKPGAFERSIQEDQVVGLFNHNPDIPPLGSTASRDLRLWEDAHGLGFELLGPFTQSGREIHEAITLGRIRGASFGFRALEAPEVEEDGVLLRELRKVQLIDVSPVTFPAYQATQVSARSWAEARMAVDTRPGRRQDQRNGPDPRSSDPLRANRERRLELLERRK